MEPVSQLSNDGRIVLYCMYSLDLNTSVSPLGGMSRGLDPADLSREPSSMHVRPVLQACVLEHKTILWGNRSVATGRPTPSGPLECTHEHRIRNPPYREYPSAAKKCEIETLALRSDQQHASTLEREQPPWVRHRLASQHPT